MTARGKVFLVGAGPGAPDLITVRGLRALREASWIIADSLIPEGYLLDVGLDSSTKVTHLDHSDTRDRHATIMEQVILAAEAGQTVVRLKNGDPFVFGRGCEEIAALDARNIPWEVVPGLSVCTAGASIATLPLTSRDTGRSFAVVTARCNGGQVNLDYPQADTLVIFMGTGVLARISEILIQDGWSPQTPSAVLSRVSLAWERQCVSRLDRIAAQAAEHHITAPAILIVGQAAVSQDALPHRPRVLFAGDDPSEHNHLGQLIHWPALVAETAQELRPALDRRFDELIAGRFGWILFHNATSARFFFREMDRRRLDSRSLARVRIAAKGHLAGHVLREHGLRVDYQLDGDPQADRAWAKQVMKNQKVLVCRGRDESHALDASIQSTAAILYEYRQHPDLGLPLPDHDAIFFTKPAEVRAYLQAYGPKVLEGDVWYENDETRAAVDAGLKRSAIDRNRLSDDLEKHPVAS